MVESSAPARRLWAGFQLLDRQLVDRDGRMAGNVDDLDLTRDEVTGTVYVTALLSGPGALSTRLGWRRLGRWLRRVAGFVSATEDDPIRIPLGRVADVADHVTLSLDRDEVGSALGERWVRDHVIAHIPGSRHEAE